MSSRTSWARRLVVPIPPVAELRKGATGNGTRSGACYAWKEALREPARGTSVPGTTCAASVRRENGRRCDMTSYAIVLALSTLGFDGGVVGPSAQAQVAAGGPPAAAIACGDCSAPACGASADCGHGHWGNCGGHAPCRLHCLNGMPQHFPYLTPGRGYYFFRPYNTTVLADQHAEVAAIGGNPLHPYDNRFFERIYQEVEALPGASAVPAPYPVPPPSIPPVMPVAPSDPLPALPATR